MDLGDLFHFAQDQMKYVLYIALFALIAITAYRRAWIGMIGSIVGLAVVAVFIMNPELLNTLGTWATDLISLGG